ncbi:MAG: type II toxin-antitoxin system HicA family toxin [Bacteroidales bacterium]|nr:type II toxin-antitoxin system HicA family toxin [Bacteroidales bacterium]
MTWKELERIAVKNGWRFLRHGGRHDVYFKSGKTLQIERHWSQEVRIGLLLKILRIIDEN